MPLFSMPRHIFLFITLPLIFSPLSTSSAAATALMMLRCLPLLTPCHAIQDAFISYAAMLLLPLIAITLSLTLPLPMSLSRYMFSCVYVVYVAA